jgi:hypothetical protein
MPVQMRRDGNSSESLGTTLSQMTSQLAGDGQAWLKAEASLAKAHLASDGRRVAILLGLGTLALATVCSGFMLVLLWAVATLAPHVGGLGNAAGTAGVALCAVAALSIWSVIRGVRTHLGVSAIAKRWLAILTQGPGRTS